MTHISPIKLIALVVVAFLVIFSSFASENTDHALRTAATQGQTRTVNELLRQGANPNSEGLYGETALYATARYNQPKTAFLLIKAGADPEQRDAKDQTALMAASRFCSPRVGKQIIQARANVNWQDLHGRTALMYAAATGCWQMVESILKANGVDVNIKDDEGYTALDLIMEEKSLEVGGTYTDIHRMLIKAGAKHSRWIEVQKTTVEKTSSPKPPLQRRKGIDPVRLN